MLIRTATLLVIGFSVYLPPGQYSIYSVAKNLLEIRAWQPYSDSTAVDSMAQDRFKKCAS